MDRKITIIMTTGNEGFQTNYDVAKVLIDLGRRVDEEGGENVTKFLDVNGNTVGTVKIEKV